MNDSKIAFRAKEQLGKFLGKVFTHFSKPRKKFLADMLAVACQSGRRKTVPLALKLWSSRDSGNCSPQTFAEVGGMRIEKREAPQILRSGSGSHTVRSSSRERKTPIPLMKTRLTLYLSG